ncbi:MAG: hypothetical protein ACK5L5_09480 [Bacteroidales bacterium]
MNRSIKLTYQRIYYPMRDMTFFSLSELNCEIHYLLEGCNNLLFKRKEASRRELFLSVEHSYLKPLPSSPFQLKSYCRGKVQKIGYVYSFDALSFEMSG